MIHVTDQHGVSVYPVQTSTLAFTVRLEGADFVLCFANRRIHYCRTLEKARRAARLWARMMARGRRLYVVSGDEQKVVPGELSRSAVPEFRGPPA